MGGNLRQLPATATSELPRLGIDRRSAHLKRAISGVRVGRDLDLTLMDRCRAYQLVLEDPCFSHETALGLLGVDLPGRREIRPALHVLVTDRRQRSRREGLASHFTTRPPRTIRIAGIRITDPARAWLDSSRFRSLDDTIVLADAVLRRKSPASSLIRLQREVLESGMTPGIQQARIALQLARANTDSVMETRTRLVLVRGGLPCPEVNVEIRADDGQFLALGDMVYRKEKLLVEYDGDIHRTDRVTWQRDERRKRALEFNGWQIITVTADDVLRNPANLIDIVRRTLHRRGGQSNGARY